MTGSNDARNVNGGRGGGVAGDFAVGCLVFVLIAIALPFLVFVLKLTFWLAALLAFAIGVFVGVVLLGKLVRKLI